jgi:DNA-binding NtrC family response regulator
VTRYRRSLEGFDPEAMRSLMHYAWPGNVRELEHTIERAVLLARDRVILPADLNIRSESESAGSGALEELPLEAVERHLIRKALERYEGNVSRAADALGLSRSALYRRLEKYGLQ